MARKRAAAPPTPDSVQAFYIDGHPDATDTELSSLLSLPVEAITQYRAGKPRKKPSLFAEEKGVVSMTMARSSADDRLREAGAGSPKNPWLGRPGIYVPDPDKPVR